MSETPNDFKPSYVWPNPAFPFREYYVGDSCRIFIIENIQHNWIWMSKWASNFRSTDYFLVYCGWYHSKSFASEANTIFEILKLNKKSFFFMFNSSLEESNFKSFGFFGDVINHNAWLNENAVMKPLQSAKKFNAVYVARRSKFKRHYLAANVKGLALVAGINHGNDLSEIPEAAYINSSPLTPFEVCEKINESSCGLILSESEGACFSSSEYLLCGVPVVSTASTGGRDVWYNDYNSIVCDATPESIASAVDEFVLNPRDPLIIRNSHLELAYIYRRRFIDFLSSIFLRHGVAMDSEKYFSDNYCHKLRKSYKPDFQKIFG